MPGRVFYCIQTHDFLREVNRRPVDRFSAKKVRATQQGAIRKIRTSDNRRWPQPILDALRAKHHESVVEAQRRSGSHWAPEEYSFSRCEKSPLIKPALFRVRRIFDYHWRGGPHSLFRDRTKIMRRLGRNLFPMTLL